MAAVNLGELELAVDFVSSGMPGEHRAYVSIDTGAIHWVSASMDLEEDVPADLEESDRYLDVPGRMELDLGRVLALRFMDERLPEDSDTVVEFFHHRGAFRRFKAFLAARGQLDAWHAFEAQWTERALLEWCAAQGLEVIRDVP